MSDKQAFSDQVQQQLSKVKAAVDRAQAEIRAANSRELEEVRAERDQLAAEMRTHQQEVEAAKARMKSYLDKKKAETDAKIDEWMAKEEVQRLEVRANDAQDYFSATLVMIAAAVDEARAAALASIEARRAADKTSAKHGAKG